MTDTPKKVRKTDEDWQQELTPEQYHVTRMKGTERAFTGEYWDHKGEGVYRCVCCEEPLFSSETKYDSGTGWPSFWTPVDGQNVETEEDRSFFMRRTEVHCAACGGRWGGRTITPCRPLWSATTSSAPSRSVSCAPWSCSRRCER